MTEEEWLACGDGVKLAGFWGARFTERKARLLMLACCRRREHIAHHSLLREATEALASHYSDPNGSDQPFDEDVAQVFRARLEEFLEADPPQPVMWVTCAVESALKSSYMLAEDNQTLDWLVWSCLTDVATETDDTSVIGEGPSQAMLVRDVLGNPFRSPELLLTWRTDTVVALARQMYVREEFSAMPILADALQDAGCDNEDILNHCRDVSATHVRGCWVVDLVLGKS